jgi:hypothetical protein
MHKPVDKPIPCGNNGIIFTTITEEHFILICLIFLNCFFVKAIQAYLLGVHIFSTKSKHATIYPEIRGSVVFDEEVLFYVNYFGD